MSGDKKLNSLDCCSRGFLAQKIELIGVVNFLPRAAESIYIAQIGRTDAHCDPTGTAQSGKKFDIDGGCFYDSAREHGIGAYPICISRTMKVYALAMLPFIGAEPDSGLIARILELN